MLTWCSLQSGTTPLQYRHAPDKKDGPSRRSKGRSKRPPKGPSTGASRGPSKGGSLRPSRSQSREPSRNNSPEAPTSKGPSRASSRAGADADGDVQKAIAAAETEDYNLLSDLIVRGDGDTLVGHSSQDPEVNAFLEKVPQHLVGRCGVLDSTPACCHSVWCIRPCMIPVIWLSQSYFLPVV